MIKKIKALFHNIFSDDEHNIRCIETKCSLCRHCGRMCYGKITDRRIVGAQIKN